MVCREKAYHHSHSTDEETERSYAQCSGCCAVSFRPQTVPCPPEAGVVAPDGSQLPAPPGPALGWKEPPHSQCGPARSSSEATAGRLGVGGGEDKSPVPLASIWGTSESHPSSRAPLGWAEATIAATSHHNFSLARPASVTSSQVLVPRVRPVNHLRAHLHLRVCSQGACPETPR